MRFALKFGGWQQSQAAGIYHDIRCLVDAGVPVYAVRDNIKGHGLQQSAGQNGVALVGRNEAAGFYEQVDQIWQG